MFNWLKRKFAEALIKGINIAPPERIKEVLRQSVEKQKEKYQLGKPSYFIIEADNVTHLVDEELTPKIYRDVEFYANVATDKYYLADKENGIIVAYGNLDGQPPEVTINKDLETHCAYYNVIIAFVLDDQLRLNYYFNNPIQFKILKEEMISIGWNMNIGPVSTKIKDHDEVI